VVLKIVLRNHYTRRTAHAARQWAALAAASLLTAGCSLWGSSSAPVTTGSIAEPVAVQRPLPSTLAYSDAAKIGQAASAVLWQAEGGAAPAEWANARTGSSGTLTAAGDDAPDNCAPFSTTVTSLGGVHQYSGTVCRDNGTRTVLQITEESGDIRS
jgi:hypothetical protein